MRITAVGLIFILLLPGVLPASEIQYITGQELKESGITRLSDIHLLLDDWAVSTIDGFTWFASPNGLDNYEWQRWILMIDGIQVDIDIFDIMALGRLPVLVSQIDYIAVSSEPTLYEGYLTDGGLIDIRLIRPDTTGTAIAEFSAGNETKDPGPLRYTEQGSPNVDKVGAASAIYAGISGQDRAVGLSYKNETNYNSDPAIIDRNYAVLKDEYPRIEVSGGMIFFDYNGPKFESTTRYIFSDFDDLFFERDFGNEIPTRTVLQNFGHSHRVDLDSGLIVNSRFSYSVNRLDPRPNNLNDFGYDWEQRIYLYNLELLRRWDNNQIVIGAGFNHYEVKTSPSLQDDDFNLLRIYTGFQFAPQDFLELSLIGEVTGGKTSHACRIMHRAALKYFKGSRIEFTCLYYRRLPEQNPNLYYWIRQGYHPFTSIYFTASEIDFQLNYNRPEGFDWDLNLAQEISDNIKFDLGLFYRYFSKQYKIVHFKTRSANTIPFFTNAGIGEFYYRGEIWGADLGLKIKPIDPLTVNLRINVFNKNSSFPDWEFRRTWEAVPDRKFRIKISYNPTVDLSINSIISYQGGTSWREYNIHSTNPEENISDRVSGFSTVDLAITKYFWGRRIRGTLAFRNIFDDNVRYHPIGAEFERSYYAVLEINPF